MYEQLPTFQSGGDVILLFEQNEKLYVDKALLAVHSRYMGKIPNIRLKDDKITYLTMIKGIPKLKAKSLLNILKVLNLS